MKDYRYSLPLKSEFSKKANQWFKVDPKLKRAVLKRVKSEGPLRSKDFDKAKMNKSGWWDWKPSKKALESLFLEGKLEISHREGFQKFYDIPENIIPSNIECNMPTEEEYYRYLITRTLRHHSFASVNEITYLKKKEHKIKTNKYLKLMLREGEIIRVKIEGIDEEYYSLVNAFDKIPRENSKISILSPFDNLIIQRKKLKDLFGFDYNIECYVPEEKRKYGYFCLPILSGKDAVARLDCKADRENKKLIIKSLHFEKNIDQSSILPKLELKLKQFAKFNSCKSFSNLEEVIL